MREEAQTSIVPSDMSIEDPAIAAPPRTSKVPTPLMATVALATAGAAAGTAFAENRMKPLMPRGFSVSNPPASTLANTAENEATAAAPITVKAAARFLAQATMGTKKGDIARVQALEIGRAHV